MAERTLADFARSIGVRPGTARVWKKRGKIIEKDGGFELVADAQREWVGLAPSSGAGSGEDAGKLAPDSPSEDGDQDAQPSGLMFYGTNLDLPPWPEDGKVYVRTPSGTSPERIAELRAKFAERKAKATHCAGCADLAVGLAAARADIASLVTENTELRDRIAGLETDIRFMRTRIGEPGPAPVAITVSAADQAAAMIEAHRARVDGRP